MGAVAGGDGDAGMSDPSLHQILRSLGYSIEPVADPMGHSKAIMRDGAEVFRGDSLDVWIWLRSTGQIPPLVKCSTCAHGRPRSGCGHPDAVSLERRDAFWGRDADPDEAGRPWCHSRSSVPP